MTFFIRRTLSKFLKLKISTKKCDSLSDLSDDGGKIGWSVESDSLKGVAVGLHDASYSLAKGVLRMAIL